MSESLMWHLNGKEYTMDGKFEDTSQFQEVYLSKNKKVRIVQVLDVSEESRQWAIGPESRQCDAPGSWYCPGRYPPLLELLIGENATQAPREIRAEAAAYRAEFQRRKEAQMALLPKPN